MNSDEYVRATAAIADAFEPEASDKSLLALAMSANARIENSSNLKGQFWVMPWYDGLLLTGVKGAIGRYGSHYEDLPSFRASVGHFNSPSSAISFVVELADQVERAIDDANHARWTSFREEDATQLDKPAQHWLDTQTRYQIHQTLADGARDYLLMVYNGALCNWAKRT